MTPAPAPNKTVKKASPLATPLAYIQRQWHLLSIVARWMRLMLTKDNLRAYLRRHWRLLALLILYIFFRPTFEEKLASLLQFFDPSWGSFIVWLGIVGILIALVCTHSLGYEWYLFSQKYSKSFVAILFGLWAYYHWGKVENYETTPTPIPGVYYMDIFLVLCACLLIVRVRSYREERCRQRALRARMRQATLDGIKEGYQIDQPTISKDEDLLGRRAEAESLAEKIFKTDTSKGAFTLGLTAPWGAGKTSFMLVMREYLRKKPSQEVIVMSFNPWMYRKAPNLTQVFFEELSRTLAPYNSDLASAFIRYVRSLLAQESNAWLQLAARLLPQESNEKSITEQYESLSQEICRLGRKIFIFIDDVDRLEREELVELFALVRNSSSFPCMSYILAYDKEYVASQLKGCFDQHTHRYVEKILQEEYVLAQITPEQLEQALKRELKRIGYGDLWVTLEESRIQISHHLPTIRAVKRICNTLSSRRKELERNVILFDWFILELIRTQYPILFDFLRVRQQRVFERRGMQCVIGAIKVTEEELAWVASSLLDYPKYGVVVSFSCYLSEHHEYFQIKNVALVNELVMALWSGSRGVAELQANHVDYIGRYFYRALRDDEIDLGSLCKLLSSPFEAIKPYIQEKYATCQWVDFCSRICDEVERQEDVVKMLVILFYMHSISTELEAINSINRLIDTLRAASLGREEFKRALDYILEYKDIRVGILRYFGYAGEYGYSSTIPLKQEELEEIKERLFLLYVKEANPLNPIECYCLWFRDRIATKVASPGETILEHSKVIAHPKMDSMMKQIIEKNIELLIPCFIQQSSLGEAEYELLLPDPIWTLDKGENDLEVDYFPDFVLGLDGDSSLIVKEFQEFLRKYLKIGSNTIQFDFNHITPANIRWASMNRLLFQC